VTLVRAAVRAALLCGFGIVAALQPAAAQSAGGPTKQDAPQGRIGELVWMMGNWDCEVVERKDPSEGTRMWRRIALGPGGHELYVLQGELGTITRTKIGYDATRGRWYETDQAGQGPSAMTHTMLGSSRALQAHSFALDGFVEGPHRERYPMRIVYAWPDHDGFTLRAQLLRRDGKWSSFQKQTCRRSDEVR
jgi:hypothetical protein